MITRSRKGGSGESKRKASMEGIRRVRKERAFTDAEAELGGQ